MRGLIIKDLLNLKKQGVFLGVFIIIYFFISIQMGNESFFAGVLLIMFAIMPMTAMSYDERAKWDKYALSMPVSRIEIVMGKYVLGLLLVAVAFIGVVISTSIIGDMAFKENVVSALAIACAGIAMMTVLLPIIFKVGVEKARYAMIAVFTAPMVAIFMVGKLVDDGSITMPQFDQINYTLLAGGLIVAVIALFMVSSFISLKIYSKKEF